MTHSDKAWSVINELRETWCYGPCNYQEGCGCSDAIAAAIREAENAAYDKAATIAVQNAQNAFLSGSSDGQTIAFVIATAIRALKTESNPQQ